MIEDTLSSEKKEDSKELTSDARGDSEIESDPKLEEQHFNSAKLFEEQQSYCEAIKMYQILIKLNPSKQIYFFNLAELYRQDENKEMQLLYLNKCIEIDKKHQKAFFLIGKLLFEKNEIDEAIKYFEIQIKANEKHINSYIKLSEILIEKGHKKEAINVLQTCLEHNSDSEKIIILLINLFIKEGEVEKLSNIELTFSKLKEKILNSTHYKSGLDHIKKKIKQKAISSFKNAIEEYPLSPTLKYEIASIYLKEQYNLISVPILKSAIQLAPSYYHCRFRLAEIYFGMKIFDQAEIQLRSLLDYQPSHSLALFLLGKIELQNKNYKSALKYFKKSIQNCDRCSGIYGAIGYSYWKLGKIAKATAHLEVSVSEKETNFSDLPQYTLGKCYMMVWKADKALSCFRGMQGTISKSENPKVECHLQIANYNKDGTCIGCFNENTVTQLKPRIFMLTCKESLYFALKHNAKQEYKFLSRICYKVLPKMVNHDNSDFKALICEGFIVCGYHILLAIKCVEQGLGETRFKQGINNWESIPGSDLNDESKIGCYLQVAQIQLLIGEKKNSLMTIQKVLSLIESTQAKKKEKMIDTVNSVQEKKLQKSKWFIINWKPSAVLLLAEIEIELSMLEKASETLKYLMKLRLPHQSNCIKHLCGQLDEKRGFTQKAIEKYKENNTYSPSLFSLGQILLNQRKDEEGIKNIDLALNCQQTHLQYLIAASDFYHDRRNYTMSNSLYERYIKEVKSQNEWLKQNSVEGTQIDIQEVLNKVAMGYFYQQNYQSALKFFQESLQINPSQTSASEIVEIINVLMNNKEQAEKSLVELVMKQQNADTFYLLGLFRINSKDDFKAKIYFEKADLINPFHYLVLQQLGELNLKEKKFKQAKQYFLRAFDIFSSDQNTLIGLSKCLWKIDRYVNNEELNEEKLIESRKLMLKSQKQILNYYQQVQNLSKEVFIDKFQNIFDQHRSIIFYLGDSFFHSGKKDVSHLNISESLLLFLTQLPNSNNLPKRLLSLTNLILAQINFFKQDFQNVNSFLKQYTPDCSPLPGKLSEYDFNLSKEKYDYLMLLARINIIKGDHNPPKLIGKCIKIDPLNYFSYSQMAFFLLTKGSKRAWEFHKKAISCLQNAQILEFPEQIFILNALEAVNSNNFKSAKEQLREILLKSKQNQACMFFLGEILMKESNFAEAIEMYQQSYENEKQPLNCFESYALSNEQKQNNLAQMAKALYRIGENNKALIIIQKCLDLKEDQTTALMIKSQILLKIGDTLSALQFAKNSIRLDPQQATTHYILAVIELRAGNIEFAYYSLQRCEKLNPNFPDIKLILAKIHQRVAKPEAALQLLLNHLAVFPNSKYALLNSSKLLAYFHKFQQSHQNLNILFNILQKKQDCENEESQPVKDPYLLPMIEEAFQIEEDQIDLFSAYSVQAYLLAQEENYEGAIASLQSSLNIKPNDEYALSTMAMIFSKIGKHNESIYYYELVLHNKKPKSRQNLSKDHVGYLVNLGNEFKATNNISNAIQSYKQALQLSGQKSSNIFANLASCYIQSHDYDEAIAILEQVLKSTPNHLNSLYLLGIAYKSIGINVLSSKCFELAIEEDPNFLPVCIYLAQQKYEIGKFQESIKVCENCLKKSPKNIQIRTILCRSFIKMNNYEKALSFYLSLQQELKSSEGNSQLKFLHICNIQISRIYSMMKNPDKAISHLKSYLLTYPHHPYYLNEIGQIILEQQDFEEAASLFKRAIKISPKNATFHFNLANAESKLNKYEYEVETLLKCLSLNPPFKDKVYNNIGLAYQSLYQRQKALKFFQKSIEENPNLVESHFNLGNLHILMRNSDLAIQEYQKCLQINKKHLGALINLTQTFIRKEDYQSVVNLLSECIKLDPKNKETYTARLKILLNLGFSPNNDS